MRLLKSARKDRIGEAINVRSINMIYTAHYDDKYYICVCHTDKETIITNNLSLDVVQTAYNNLIKVLRDKKGYDDWSDKWVQCGTV